MVTPYGRGSVCVSCALVRLNAPEPGPEGTPSGSGCRNLNGDFVIVPKPRSLDFFLAIPRTDAPYWE